MPIYTRQLNCCAGAEIENLFQYGGRGGGKKAMLELCRQIYATTYSPLAKPKAFYVFNGVVGYKKGSWETRTKTNRRSYKTDYVPNFAEFILKNKLGNVGTTAPEWNRTGAPSHKVMMCVWRPDPKALKAWYKKNKPKAPTALAV